MNLEVGDFTTAGIIIIATAVIWLSLDVWLFVDKKETLSQRLHVWSRYFGAINFIAGMLCGHWFW